MEAYNKLDVLNTAADSHLLDIPYTEEVKNYKKLRDYLQLVQAKLKIVNQNEDIDLLKTIPIGNANKYDFPIKGFYNRTHLNIRKYFYELQKWICHITEVYEDSFKAKMIDQNDPLHPEEDIFLFKEVSTEDRSFIQLGAVFYYSIGYISENGQISKKDTLRFQRIGQWDDSTFDEAIDEADDFYKKLVWK
jgi:hypothetical protein